MGWVYVAPNGAIDAQVMNGRLQDAKEMSPLARSAK